MTRETVFKYAKEKYGTIPDHPWKKYPKYAILRHLKNQKWYGAVINIPRNKLGLNGDDTVDVLNVKCEKDLAILLKDNKAIFSAYHMNKKNWTSILLEKAENKMVFDLISQSYKITL
ncbi:MmcQ/YjbR family DNA-binding protein [Campylobacter fetus]|nr:MmcQ/YjbR family DNA-binding protein [Campylobacter fetus]EJU9541133.1 MmcQ/YjbR family DNA-binding protein [Campylobacter fetus]